MRFHKKEGQHILKDKALLKRIVSYAELSQNDTVLEIGCGTGNLTEFILKRAGKVYGIEKDRRFVRLLENRFDNEILSGRFLLIEGDALKIEWPDFDKFVSNIPYNISTEITFRLLKSDFKMGVVMYQREFAERLTAKPGTKEYGRLSVVMSLLCKAEIVEYVRAKAFYPKPKVDSAVVKIVPKKKVDIKNPEKLDLLLRTAFSMRRKKFGNVAKKLNLTVPKEIENERPENIPPEVYAELSERL